MPDRSWAMTVQFHEKRTEIERDGVGNWSWASIAADRLELEDADGSGG